MVAYLEYWPSVTEIESLNNEKDTWRSKLVTTGSLIQLGNGSNWSTQSSMCKALANKLVAIYRREYGPEWVVCRGWAMVADCPETPSEDILALMIAVCCLSPDLIYVNVSANISMQGSRRLINVIHIPKKLVFSRLSAFGCKRSYPWQTMP